MPRVDTLIVGQGLAGSLLAWTLLKRGQRVLLVDDAHASAASTVAAGLLNPITGQRMVKGAEVDGCLASAQRCYRALEGELGCTLLHEMPMWRLFQNDREREAWQKRCADPAYADYLGEPLAPMRWPHAPLGGFVQRHTGYLDTRRLLDGLRHWLQDRQSYREEVLDYRQVEPSRDGVSYCGVQARRLIFCEGWRVRENPWFDWLPLAPSRGTILTLHSDARLPEAILNQGRWLMPRGGGEYRLGASYDREHLEADPDQHEIAALAGLLANWFDPPPRYRLDAVQSGVRPNTRDKQPLLGLHPHHPALGVFNGFGSRGSLLIPWHATLMAAHLENGEALPAALSIQRCAG